MMVEFKYKQENVRELSAGSHRWVGMEGDVGTQRFTVSVDLSLTTHMVQKRTHRNYLVDCRQQNLRIMVNLWIHPNT